MSCNQCHLTNLVNRNQKIVRSNHIKTVLLVLNEPITITFKTNMILKICFQNLREKVDLPANVKMRVDEIKIKYSNR